MAAARAMREVGEGQVRARGSAHEAPKAEGMPQRREGIMAPTSPAVRVRITLIRISQVGFAGATYPRRGTDVKPGLPVGSTGNHLDGSATRGPTRRVRCRSRRGAPRGNDSTSTSRRGCARAVAPKRRPRRSRRARSTRSALARERRRRVLAHHARTSRADAEGVSARTRAPAVAPAISCTRKRRT